MIDAIKPYGTNVKYVGEYKNGFQHGQGTMTSPRGDEYIGTWKDDERHGLFVCNYIDGSKHTREYKNGVLQSSKFKMVRGPDRTSVTVRKGTNTVYHSVCKKSAIFCQIFDTKTLTPEHVATIKTLGFDVYQSRSPGQKERRI